MDDAVALRRRASTRSTPRIVEGRPNGMPSFRGKIPDQQIWQLAAYVRAMSGNVAQGRRAEPSRCDGRDAAADADPEAAAAQSEDARAYPRRDRRFARRLLAWARPRRSPAATRCSPRSRRSATRRVRSTACGTLMLWVCVPMYLLVLVALGLALWRRAAADGRHRRDGDRAHRGGARGVRRARRRTAHGAHRLRATSPTAACTRRSRDPVDVRSHRASNGGGRSNTSTPIRRSSSPPPTNCTCRSDRPARIELAVRRRHPQPLDPGAQRQGRPDPGHDDTDRR